MRSACFQITDNKKQLKRVWLRVCAWLNQYPAVNSNKSFKEKTHCPAGRAACSRVYRCVRAKLPMMPLMTACAFSLMQIAITINLARGEFAAVDAHQIESHTREPSSMQKKTLGTDPNTINKVRHALSLKHPACAEILTRSYLYTDIHCSAEGGTRGLSLVDVHVGSSGNFQYWDVHSRQSSSFLN